MTAGLVIVVLLAIFLAIKLAGPGPQPDPTMTSGTPTPSNTETAPLPSELSLTCTLTPAPSRRGQQVTLSYVIDSPKPQRVGFGAGVRHGDTDYANGDGDEDSVVLRPGRQTIRRSLTISDDVPRGRYEITGEIWPANEVGTEGAETLADRVCGDAVTLR